MKSFEEKVRSMSASQIIMEMVKGLQNPKTEVLMSTYGTCQDYVCYGCAATNAVMKISKIEKFKDGIIGRLERSLSINSDIDLLENFEYAINALRMGYIDSYNSYANEGQFSLINVEDFSLPVLSTRTYKENLQPYINLAKKQKAYERKIKASQDSKAS